MQTLFFKCMYICIEIYLESAGKGHDCSYQKLSALHPVSVLALSKLWMHAGKHNMDLIY